MIGSYFQNRKQRHSSGIGKRSIVDLIADSKKRSLEERSLGEQVLRMLHVNVGIDDGFPETSPAEWYDNPSSIVSDHKIIGIKSLGDFAERMESP